MENILYQTCIEECKRFKYATETFTNGEVDISWNLKRSGTVKVLISIKSRGVGSARELRNFWETHHFFYIRSEHEFQEFHGHLLQLFKVLKVFHPTPERQ